MRWPMAIGDRPRPRIDYCGARRMMSGPSVCKVAGPALRAVQARIATSLKPHRHLRSIQAVHGVAVRLSELLVSGAHVEHPRLLEMMERGRIPESSPECYWSCGRSVRPGRVACL